MPRYEVADGVAHKFWEITFAGKTFTVRWGRMGIGGARSQVKHFANEVEARRAYDELVAEKRRKGYKLVGDESKDLRAWLSRCAKLEQLVLPALRDEPLPELSKLRLLRLTYASGSIDALAQSSALSHSRVSNCSVSSRVTPTCSSNAQPLSAI